jgi:hypothetical protein
MAILPAGNESSSLIETVGTPASDRKGDISADNQLSYLERLKKYSGRIMVTTMLSTTLLLGACSGDSSDCVPATPPPTQPGSSGFTAAQPANSSTGSGTYCRSRTTGGYYYSSGYSSSSSSSGSS